jgi:hypothetical protein
MHEYERSRATGADWRERAERIVGQLKPYASRTLSASELGQFAYCPQAWFLARCNIPVDEDARLRLEAGTRAHCRIGRRTDLLRAQASRSTWCYPSSWPCSPR